MQLTSTTPVSTCGQTRQARLHRGCSCNKRQRLMVAAAAATANVTRQTQQTHKGESFERVTSEPASGKAPRLRLKEQDHCALECVDLELMERWYTDVLGCEKLPRPPFPFGGAWLRAGSNLVIHLIQQMLQDETVPRKVPTGADHWKERFSEGPEPWYVRRSFHNAFCVHSLEETEEALQARGITYNKFIVPGTKEGAQLFLFDPEGNGIELGAGYQEIKASVGLA